MTEQEEKDLRERLENELEDGCYKIGGETIIAYTGKQGYINYEIALRKAVENYGKF